MVFIVAEIGVNWDGDFQLMEKMIQSAKSAGCNAVKFQAYNLQNVKDHPERKRLLKSAITESNIETVDSLAKKIGIEWFCTPMYPESVDFLNPYLGRLKVREIDGRPLIQNKLTPLLEKILNSGKEIIISSQVSPITSEYYKNSSIRWLYCVPKYPCSLEMLNFENFQDFDGYSNHTPDAIAPLTASILGARIIEIHITSDKTKNYFDNNVSFDNNELEKLVDMIRSTERITRHHSDIRKI